ncbi:MAG TPA: diaminopimelate epimerase [Thermoanaerobaculia bacterium]|jgi:diaminopimelate epimerase
MAGGGNDFVVIDNRDRRIADAGELTRRICTRAVSVGADGLILVEPSVRATFRMRYYNSDGGLSDFCANGTRCAARFAFLNVIAPRKMTIETDAGIVSAEVGEHGWVTLTLPTPHKFTLERPLEINGRNVTGSFILVGVPHYVVFVDDVWSLDVVKIGKLIRHHRDLVPDGGANANFVAVRDPHSIEVRTYERGVEAETLSCGSGVVASVSTAALFGQVESPVSVLTRSGVTFEVSFRKEGRDLHELRLRGDARLVFRSQLTPETVDGFDPEFVRNPTARVAAS